MTFLLLIILLLPFKQLEGSTSEFCLSTAPKRDLELVDLLKKRHIKLIVIRHGQAEHNINHLMCSSKSENTLTINLTPKGRKQVEEAAKRLKNKNIEWMYVSPVTRTQQSAKIIKDILHLPSEKIFIDADLQEQYFGDYEGRSYEDYEAFFKHPEDVYICAVPNGESGIALYNRTHRCLKRIAAKHENTTILIVTHAFVCSQISYSLTGSYNNVPEQAEFKIY